MTLEQFNNLDSDNRFEELLKCCGSTNWANSLNTKFPFSNIDSLMQESDEIWRCISDSDIFEAFTHHPKIGDIKSLEEKFATTKQWASAEQSGVQQAKQETIEALAKGNEDYVIKFGYIFIVCASGKTADEILALLLNRLPNNAETELKIAAAEQNKITHIRLNKLLL